MHSSYSCSYYPSASQIPLSAPWRASAADQTFSVNRKYFIVSCICAQKQYVDFRSVILDLLKAGFALARLGWWATDWANTIPAHQTVLSAQNSKHRGVFSGCDSDPADRNYETMHARCPPGSRIFSRFWIDILMNND